MSLGSSQPVKSKTAADPPPGTGDEMSGDLPMDSARYETTGEVTQANSGLSGVQAPGRAVLPKIIPFDTLARCGEEIWIENNGQIYRLRRTKQGKLILTK
ncbi:MAG: hemin uptake protein HemP [Pirellulaceae bacterium]